MAKALQTYRQSEEFGAEFHDTKGTEDMLSLCNETFDVLNRRCSKEGINLKNWKSQKSVIKDTLELFLEF